VGRTPDPGGVSAAGLRRALTRVLVTRHPPHGHHQPGGQHPGGRRVDHDHGPHHGPTADHGSGRDDQSAAPEPTPAAHNPPGPAGLQVQLRTAMALLPPPLGGAPSQPLDLGRATRVIHPTQPSALAVRDGGCVFPGCDRPLGWCDAHHLHHWVHGGPTDLANLALLCRAHHRAVHEGGWHLARGPDGRFAATPPHRRHRRPPRHYRRQPAMA
jgi:hypothetical protein